MGFLRPCWCYHQQVYVFIINNLLAKRVPSLKNQLVVMGSLEGRLRGVYSLVGPLARLQFILKSIVRDICRQWFIVALGFNTGIDALVGVITNKFMYL